MEKLNTVTLEAVKEQFVIEDKAEAMSKMKALLESTWDMEKTAELTVRIQKKAEDEGKAEWDGWNTIEKVLWVVKEAFILGGMDMAEKLMAVNDMGYNALTGEGAEA